MPPKKVPNTAASKPTSTAQPKKEPRVTKKAPKSKSDGPARASSNRTRQALGATGTNISPSTTPLKAPRRTTRSTKGKDSPLLTLESATGLTKKPRRTTKARLAALENVLDSQSSVARPNANEDVEMPEEDNYQVDDDADAMDTDAIASEIGSVDLEMDESPLTEIGDVSNESAEAIAGGNQSIATTEASDPVHATPSVVGHEPDLEADDYDGENNTTSSITVPNFPVSQNLPGPSSLEVAAVVDAALFRRMTVALAKYTETPKVRKRVNINTGRQPGPTVLDLDAATQHQAKSCANSRRKSKKSNTDRLSQGTVASELGSMSMAEPIDFSYKSLSTRQTVDSMFQTDVSVDVSSKTVAFLAIECDLEAQVKELQEMKLTYKEHIVAMKRGMDSIQRRAKLRREQLEERERELRLRDPADFWNDAGDPRFLQTYQGSGSENEGLGREADNPSDVEGATAETALIATPVTRRTQDVLEPSSPGILAVPSSIARGFMRSLASAFSAFVPSTPSKTPRKRSREDLNADERQQRLMEGQAEKLVKTSVKTPIKTRKRAKTREEKPLRSILRTRAVVVMENVIDPETGEPKRRTHYMTERKYQKLMKKVAKRVPRKKTYGSGKPSTFSCTVDLMGDSDSDMEAVPEPSDFPERRIMFDSPILQERDFYKVQPSVNAGPVAVPPTARERAERAAQRAALKTRFVPGPTVAEDDNSEIPAPTAVAPTQTPSTPEASPAKKRKAEEMEGADEIENEGEIKAYPRPKNGGFGFDYFESSDEDEPPMKKVDTRDTTPHPKKGAPAEFFGVNGVSPPLFLTTSISASDAATAQSSSMPVAQSPGIESTAPTTRPASPPQSPDPSASKPQGDALPLINAALDKARKEAEQYKPVTPSTLRRMSVLSNSTGSASPVPSKLGGPAVTPMGGAVKGMTTTVEDFDEPDSSFDSLWDDINDLDPEDRKLYEISRSPSLGRLLSSEDTSNPAAGQFILPEIQEEEEAPRASLYYQAQDISLFVLPDVEESGHAGNGNADEYESDSSIDLGIFNGGAAPHFELPELTADADPVVKYGMDPEAHRTPRTSGNITPARQFILPEIDFEEL